MVVSAVVPTWNEEPWLQRLLEQLFRQSIVGEVVVADNSSSDNTVGIAAEFGCLVVDGGRPGVGRNRGASAASGEWLLFVDADAFPTDAAFRAIEEYLERAPTTVHFALRPMTDDRSIRFAYRVSDVWFRLLQAFGVSHGMASFLLVPRSCFQKVNGFDEDLEPGEDVDFVRKCSSVCDVIYHRRDPIPVSARRFATDRRLRFMAKTALWEFQRLAGSRANLLGYNWKTHDPNEADRERAWLVAQAGELYR